jgi:toxin ParE1/3/4
MMGRRVPELDDENIRERLVYSYRVVYKVQAGRILIVAVIHGKREIENVSARFSPAP